MSSTTDTNKNMVQSGTGVSGGESFVPIADLVRQRLASIRFRTWLRRGQYLVPMAAVVAVIALRVLGGWNSGEIWVVLGILFLWLLAGVLWTMLRRPDRLESLMIWDERSGAKDMFSSALFFEQKTEGLTDGEERHLQVARQGISVAQSSLKDKLPLPSIQTFAGMSLLVLVFGLLPWLRPGIAAGDALLSEDMLEEARRQGNELAEKASLADSMKGLNEEEKEQVKKMQEMVKEASEDLSKSEGKTAREVLEDLEERARAAERLAKKLGAATDAWASEAMLKEMSQHADLADLAAALKDKNAEMSTTESERLEAMLDDAELKTEVEQRMTTALTRTMGAATEEDKAKPVGEHVGNASRKMESKQPKPAARDFGRLADHFRTVARREEAQKKMQELADKLREAGSKVSGSKLEQMKKLAENKPGAKMPKGMKPLQTGQGSSLANNPISQQNVNPSQLPIPGIQNQPQGAGQMQKGGAVPIPGSNNPQQGQGKGKGQAMAMGQGKGQGQQPGAPGLMAPIPGQGQGQMAPGAGLGGQQGQGAPGGSSVASAGGQEAGSGTTGLGANKTAAQKAVRDSTVNAQINQDGDSTLRAVQGKARQETAQRERQQAVVDFIKVEEEALDERALPLSRRDHVLKYFTALRKHFEEEKD